jgi:hypothetical protein
MSHWGQEKKFRNVRKTTIKNCFMKVFQEEDKELNARKFVASSAAGWIEPAHLCSTFVRVKHCATGTIA